MKRLAFLLVLVSFISCKNETEDKYSQTKTDETAVAISGQDLFENKGTCTACHLPDQKVIGPSIQEIAKIYKDKNGNMVSFFKGESEAIVDPSQFVLMQANIELTKTFSDEELKALEAYIYSSLK